MLTGEPLPIYAVLMAGGRGTRLWPLSREARPKQFLALRPDGVSLLQDAARRAVAVAGSLEQVLVVAHRDHAGLVRAQLPGLPVANLLLEPAGRNTAACLGLAAAHIRSRAPEAVMAVLPADHLFAEEAPWLEAVRAALDFAARTDTLVTIGMPPSRPSTSYGYLHLGAPLELPGKTRAFRVRAFIEKPPPEQASAFYSSGEYLWNTGTFAWRVSVFQAALEQYLPELQAGLQEIAADLADGDRLERLYPGFPNISVDYAVMEKAGNVAVVAGDFMRVDVGNLATLAQLWPPDTNGNAGVGDRLARLSAGNLVYTDEGLVALLGVDDLVVVRQGDVVLVCPRSRAAEVKELVESLGQAGLDQYR